MDWKEAANYAPLVTAGVAFFGTAIALASLRSQKKVARGRAAVDFFLRTEMDEATLEAHRNFKEAVKLLKQSPSVKSFIELHAEPSRHMRTYLTVHELIAVGVRRKVFSNIVCYNFWSAELLRAHDDCEAYIEYVCHQPREAATFWELKKLSKKWRRKLKRWEWRQGWKAMLWD